MDNTKQSANMSLFPYRDSIQQVEAEGLAQLPITKPNELIALLRIHENTLWRLAEKAGSVGSPHGSQSTDY
jgi:hypothetical protein